MFSSGDFVVYVDYGIGCYYGLEVIMVVGVVYECISLEYVEKVKLYLLVENIEFLLKYGYDEGLFDCLGGGVW